MDQLELVQRTQVAQLVQKAHAKPARKKFKQHNQIYTEKKRKKTREDVFLTQFFLSVKRPLRQPDALNQRRQKKGKRRQKKKFIRICKN